MFDRIKRKFYSTLKMGLKDERGIMGLYFSITLLMLVGITGMTIEFARVTKARIELQKIANAASDIALRNYMTTKNIDAAREAAQQYINSINKAQNQQSIDIRSIDVPDDYIPKVTVRLGSPDDSSYVYIQFDKSMLATSTSAVVEKDTEIAVVLDISGSMRENRRMDKAKESLKEFSDNMFELFRDSLRDVAISLVPYAGSVYLGPSYTDYGTLSAPVTKDNWLGCFRYWESAQEGWTDSVTGQGISNLKAMDDVSDVNPHSDPWCPAKNNKILEFAETSQDFTAALDRLSYADGTSTDTGMAWGFRLLSPKWRGKFKSGGPQRLSTTSAKVDKFPLDLKEGTKQKHLILLTDGRINVFRSHYNDPQAKRNFQETCKNIGEAGIIMHIVGYDIADGSQVKSELKTCASHGGQFYNADPQTLQTVLYNIQFDVLYIRTTKNVKIAK